MKSASIISVSSLAVFTLSAVGCQRAPESPSSVLSQDGVPIHYEVQGSGEPTLVFVHGWSCDRSYWDAQVPYFSNRHRVVTIDLAGHGESGLSRENWTTNAFGQDVVAVVDELDLQEVVLVGHSMGGPVVVEAARTLGDRVKLIVGADTFGDVSERWDQETMDSWLQPFRADFPAATKDMVRTMFVPTSDSTLVERIVADMSAAPPEVGLGAMEANADWWNNDIQTAFRELRVPVWLINSDYRPINVDAGREYTQSFDALVMTGVGHFVMMEDPDTFNQLLREIVEGAR